MTPSERPRPTPWQRGIVCVLKTQVSQNGKRTAWCAAVRSLTLQPSQARAMEPPTLSSVESVRLLKFLMTISVPRQSWWQAIESGLSWLEAVKVTGIAKTKRDGKTAYEPNPASTDVYWARFYDLATSQPVFPGRDGVLYPTFAEMAANNGWATTTIRRSPAAS